MDRYIYWWAMSQWNATRSIDKLGECIAAKHHWIRFGAGRLLPRRNFVHVIFDPTLISKHLYIRDNISILTCSQCVENEVDTSIRFTRRYCIKINLWQIERESSFIALRQKHACFLNSWLATESGSLLENRDDSRIIP